MPDPLENLAEIFAESERRNGAQPADAASSIQAFFAREAKPPDDLASIAAVFGQAQAQDPLQRLAQTTGEAAPPAPRLEPAPLFGFLPPPAEAAFPGREPAPPVAPEGLTGAVPAVRQLPFASPEPGAPPPAAMIEDPKLLARMGRSSAMIEAFNDKLFQDAPTEVGRLRRYNQILKRYGVPPVTELPKRKTALETLSEELGTREGLTAKLPYVGVGIEFKEYYDVLQAAGRVKEGTGTGEDWVLLADFQDKIAEQLKGRTFFGGAGKIAAESIPFMLEILTSGGMATVAKKAGRKALGKTAEHAVFKVVGEALKNQAKRKGFKAAAARGVIQAARRLPFMQHRAAAGTIERMLPDYRITPTDEQAAVFIIDQPGAPFWQAFRDSQIDLSIELVSEMSGESIGVMVGGLRRMGRRGLRTLAPKVVSVPARRMGAYLASTKVGLLAELVATGKSESFKAAVEYLKKFGWHGVINEIGEERVGEIMRQGVVNIMEMTDTETTIPPQEIPSARQVLQEAVAFTVPGVVGGVANTVSRRAQQEDLLAMIDREFPELGEEGPSPPAEPPPARSQPAAGEETGAPPPPTGPEDVTAQWQAAVREAEESQPGAPPKRPPPSEGGARQPQPPTAPGRATAVVEEEPAPERPVRARVSEAAQAAQAPTETVGELQVVMRPDGKWAVYDLDGNPIPDEVYNTREGAKIRAGQLSEEEPPFEEEPITARIKEPERPGVESEISGAILKEPPPEVKEPSPRVEEPKPKQRRYSEEHEELVQLHPVGTIREGKGFKGTVEGHKKIGGKWRAGIRLHEPEQLTGQVRWLAGNELFEPEEAPVSKEGPRVERETIEEVRRNEGEAAAQVVERFQEHGIETVETHYRQPEEPTDEGQISIRVVKLSPENRRKLENAPEEYQIEVVDHPEVGHPSTPGLYTEYVQFPDDPDVIRVVMNTVGPQDQAAVVQAVGPRLEPPEAPPAEQWKLKPGETLEFRGHTWDVIEQADDGYVKVSRMDYGRPGMVPKKVTQHFHIDTIADELGWTRAAEPEAAAEPTEPERPIRARVVEGALPGMEDVAADVSETEYNRLTEMGKMLWFYDDYSSAEQQQFKDWLADYPDIEQAIDEDQNLDYANERIEAMRKAAHQAAGLRRPYRSVLDEAEEELPFAVGDVIQYEDNTRGRVVEINFRDEGAGERFWAVDTQPYEEGTNTPKERREEYVADELVPGLSDERYTALQKEYPPGTFVEVTQQLPPAKGETFAEPGKQYEASETFRLRNGKEEMLLIPSRAGNRAEWSRVDLVRKAPFQPGDLVRMKGSDPETATIYQVEEARTHLKDGVWIADLSEQNEDGDWVQATPMDMRTLEGVETRAELEEPAPEPAVTEPSPGSKAWLEQNFPAGTSAKHGEKRGTVSGFKKYRPPEQRFGPAEIYVRLDLPDGSQEWVRGAELEPAEAPGGVETPPEPAEEPTAPETQPEEPAERDANAVRAALAAEDTLQVSLTKLLDRLQWYGNTARPALRAILRRLLRAGEIADFDEARGWVTKLREKPPEVTPQAPPGGTIKVEEEPHAGSTEEPPETEGEGPGPAPEGEGPAPGRGPTAPERGPGGAAAGVARPAGKRPAGGQRPGPAEGARARPPTQPPPVGETAEGAGPPGGEPGERPTVAPSGRGGRGGRAGTQLDDGDVAEQVSETAAPAAAEATDYRITPEDRLFEGFFGKSNKGTKEGARANILAIRTAKLILSEGRPATEEEKRILVRYVGWGAFSDIFAYRRAEWMDLGDELRDLLSGDEWNQARKSSTTAHYTPPEIIKFIYKAVELMGVKGGSMLEPGSGIGHFFGNMPAAMRSKFRRVGVELDHWSVQIARLLYPQSHFEHSEYQEASIPADFFNLAVGNPPFASTAIYDKTLPKHARSSVHRYFISKAIQQLRADGILGMVISHSYLDRLSPDYAEWLRSQAEFVTAFRLWSSAMPGTEVVVDLVFFRKRREGEEPAAHEPQFTEVITGHNEIADPVNEFFVDHPENVFGEMMTAEAAEMRALYHTGEMVVKRSSQLPLKDWLRSALEDIPEGVAEADIQVYDDQEFLDSFKTSPENLPEGSYFLDDEAEPRLWQVTGDRESPQFAERAFVSEKGGGELLVAIKQLVRMRDTLTDMIRNSIAGEDYGELQKQLKEAYHAWVKKHGGKSKSLLRSVAYKRVASEDPHTASMVSILEKKGPAPGDVLEGPIAAQRVRPTKAESVADAVAYSMAEYAELRPDYLGELLGTSPEKAIEQAVDEGLAFEEPSGVLTERALYLSGNVRQKLQLAEDAAKLDPKFGTNVKALRGVMPADIPAGKAETRLGASWLKVEWIGKFMHEVFGNDVRLEVRYIPVNAQWRVTGKGHASQEGDREWGTISYAGIRVFEAALNMRPITVKVQVDKDKYVLDPGQTELARMKAEKLQRKFKKWLWEDGPFIAEAKQRYNEEYNSLVNYKPDGSHYIRAGIAGMNPKYTPYPYQADAIWRIVVGGNVVIDVHVGGGKTMILTAAAQELQRLGRSRKTLIVIDNRTVRSFPRLAREYFPGINLMMLDANSMGQRRRRQTLARVATDPRPLTVLIPHQWLKAIPVGEQEVREFFDTQGAELEEILDEMRELYGQKSPSVNDLENAKRRNEEKKKQWLDKMKRDKGLSFAELGFDWIMYDESQKVKNLGFNTRLKVKGLGTAAGTGGSDIAMDFYMKARAVQRVQNGRGVVLSSGTPIANSLTEIYTIQRYTQHEELVARRLLAFDAWATEFAIPETRLDRTVEMKNEPVDAIRKFVNLPSLYRMWTQIAHTVTLADMRAYIDETERRVPTIKKNSAGKEDWETIIVPRTEYIDRLRVWIQHRAADIRQRMKDRLRARQKPTFKGEDTFGAIVSDGRKAGIDFRLIWPDAEEKETKIDKCAALAKRIYDEGTAPRTNKQGIEYDRTTQIIAIDVKESKHTDFQPHEAIRDQLVAAGIPSREIALMKESSNKVQEDEIVQRMNRGEVRIMVATIGKIGVGVNVQERLEALHMLGPPLTVDAITQYVGRMVRQGNKNDEVQLYRYAQEGGFDEWNFGLLFRKAWALNQWRVAGPAGEWDLEWPDDTTISFQEIEAVLSDNPYIRDANTQDLELKRLEYMFAEAEREATSVRSRIAELKGSIPQRERSITRQEEDAKALGFEDIEGLEGEELQATRRFTWHEPTALTHYDLTKGNKVVERKMYAETDKPGEVGRAILWEMLEAFSEKDYGLHTVGTTVNGKVTIYASVNSQGTLTIAARLPDDVAREGAAWRGRRDLRALKIGKGMRYYRDELRPKTVWTNLPVPKKRTDKIQPLRETTNAELADFSAILKDPARQIGDAIRDIVPEKQRSLYWDRRRLSDSKEELRGLEGHPLTTNDELRELVTEQREKTRVAKLKAENFDKGLIAPEHKVQIRGAGEKGTSVTYDVKSVSVRETNEAGDKVEPHVVIELQIKNGDNVETQVWPADYFHEQTGYQVPTVKQVQEGYSKLKSAYDDEKIAEEERRARGGGGGAAPFPPGPQMVRATVRSQFGAYSDELTPAQQDWLRKHERTPHFGMGAMYNFPDPRTDWVRWWDRIAERMVSSDNRVLKWFGRGLHGSRWGVDTPVWQGARQYKGMMQGEKERLDKLMIELADLYQWWRKAPKVEREGVTYRKDPETGELVAAVGVPVTKWVTDPETGERQQVTYKVYTPNEMLKAAAEEQTDPANLPKPVRRVYDVAQAKVREIVDEFLEDDDLHQHAEAFGLTNVMDIIKAKREGTGHYLRMILGNPPGREYSPRKKQQERRKIPQVQGGMYKARRSNELWTVKMADGQSYRQFSDPDSAWEFAYAEINANKDYYGESIHDRVTVQEPFSEEALMVAGREPEQDYRRRLARTILDLRHNLEILKFYRMIAATVAWEPDVEEGESMRNMPEGYERMSNAPQWGPLAGVALPTRTIDLLKEVRIINMGLHWQMWDLFTYSWKTAKTVYSPATRARDFFGGWYFAVLAGMGPTDIGYYRRALSELAAGEDSETYRILRDNNQLLGGYAHTDLREIEEQLFLRGRRHRTVRWDQFVEAFERIVRKHRRIANTYDFFDQMHKIAYYLKMTEKHGWSQEETLEAISRQFPNYAESGNFSDVISKSIIGQPFFRFIEATIKINLYHAKYHPVRLMLVNSLPGLLTFMSVLLLGIDDEEMALINGADWKRRRWTDRYFMPILPFRDPKTGKILQLDLRWMWPGANDFRVTTGPGGVAIPWLFNHPITNSAVNLMMNRNSYTGMDLFEPDPSAGSVAWTTFKELAGNMAPLPSTVTRGPEELWEALTTDNRSVLSVVAKHLLGIRLESPRLNRGDVLKVAREQYGQKGVEAVERILEHFNETYLTERQRPVTGESFRQSLIRARIREASEK